jgi:transcription initiation factor TFIIB
MSLGNPYETGFDEETGKTISAETCPECDGRLETEGGEITCVECGLDARQLFWAHTHNVHI